MFQQEWYSHPQELSRNLESSTGLAADSLALRCENVLARLPVYRLYECRTSLAWRLVFAAEKGRLVFDVAGDHDEVQNYLRNNWAKVHSLLILRPAECSFP